jgi:hypothetical protein
MTETKISPEKWLRTYYRTTLHPQLDTTDTNRIIGRVVLTAIHILRGGQPPATVARASALLAWVLFQRVADLWRTPMWTVEAKRIAKALRIATETLAAYTAGEPVATLNDVLDAFPKISSVTLERLWRDFEHMTATADLIADEAQERLNSL